MTHTIDITTPGAFEHDCAEVDSELGGQKSLASAQAKYGTTLAQMTKQTRLSAGAETHGTNDAMTNNDVVGNQGGRSADDTTPGALSPVETVKKAARDAFDTYQKRTGAEGDAASFEVDDNNTPVPFRAGAAEQELENLGWEVGEKTAGYALNDASHYITARKLVASDAEYGEEYVTAKIRISNHGNTTKAHDHPDVNIAPGEDIVWDIEEKLNQKITDEGYELPVSAPSDARLGYAIATEQAQRGKPSDGSGGNTTTNESSAPDSGGAVSNGRTSGGFRIGSSSISYSDASPQETAKVEAGIKGKSLVDAARFIQATGTPSQSMIAEKIVSKLERLQASGVNLKLIVAKRGDSVPSAMGRARGYTETGFDSKGICNAAP